MRRSWATRPRSPGCSTCAAATSPSPRSRSASPCWTRTSTASLFMDAGKAAAGAARVARERGADRAARRSPAAWPPCPAGPCGSIRPAPRPGSRQSLAGRRRRGLRRPRSRACCPRRARTRSSRKARAHAHRRDAVAVCRFLHWLSEHGVGQDETELSGPARRVPAEVPGYQRRELPGDLRHRAERRHHPLPRRARHRTPAAAGRGLPDRQRRPVSDGTTDITRTVWSGPGPAPAVVRDHVTRVLQGHVALASAQFPAGVHGGRLDALARAPLWQAGLDYDHGTGHGVGSFLSVHEGPCGIAPARAGADRGGHDPVRRARLLPAGRLRHAAGEPAAGAAGRRPGEDARFLRFETLTLAPFDRRADRASRCCLRRARLDRRATTRRVLAEIGPDLPEPARAWLASACAPLGASPALIRPCSSAWSRRVASMSDSSRR